MGAAAPALPQRPSSLWTEGELQTEVLVPFIYIAPDCHLLESSKYASLPNSQPDPGCSGAEQSHSVPERMPEGS